MKKFKNVKAVKARRCKAFCETYGSMKNVCIGIKEPCETTCGGYYCKCTEYDIRRVKKMVVRTPDNLCVICGAIIPEGRMICPMCGTKDDVESFAKLIRSDTSKPELMTDGLAEQTFREGYIKGFNEGMKAACELKQQNTQLRKDNAILRAAIERRDSEENKDGWYE